MFTYADLDDKDTEGIVTTITPRIGRLIGLGKLGNLAAFVGGQYIRSELEVDGTFFFGDTGLSVDYKVSQKNKDPWNITVGANWSFNKHWSATLEYGGFIGSREGIVAAATLRF